MTKAWFTTERVVAITASVFLTAALVTSILFQGDPRSIIPQTQIILPLLHAVCLALALICIFYPRFIFQYIIMQIEANLTILTNWGLLGIFLFYGSIFLLLCQTISLKKTKELLIGAVLFHIFSIALTYTHGISQTVMYAACSVFYASFFNWIYIILKSKFACFVPNSVKAHSVLDGKLAGTELKLSSYNLSERQINFILENINENLSYKELSEKYNVSISTVKKEFSSIFTVFGVKKQEELHILLLQYNLVK